MMELRSRRLMGIRGVHVDHFPPVMELHVVGRREAEGFARDIPASTTFWKQVWVLYDVRLAAQNVDLLPSNTADWSRCPLLCIVIPRSEAFTIRLISREAQPC